MQDQDKPKEISTKEYARTLAVLVTLVFWAVCIILGVVIALEKKALAITLLLCFGSLAPIFVWYIICLIREKHSGTHNRPRKLSIPLKWGIIFFLVCGTFLAFADVYRKQELDRKVEAYFGNKNPKLKAIYKKYGLEPTTRNKLPAESLKPDIKKIDEELRRRGVIE